VTADLINAFITLFVIVDPIGLAPLFMAVTVGLSSTQKRSIALKAVLIAGGVLAIFAIGGQTILATLGISLPAFRVAGGLLLLVTGFEMVFEKRTQRRENQADQSIAEAEPSNAQTSEIAVYPLAIPLIAGPGAITSLLLLMSKAEGDYPLQFGVIGCLVAVLLTTLAMFFLAERLSRVIPPSVISVITRLLGVLLCALAVQFIIDGIYSVITTHPLVSRI